MSWLSIQIDEISKSKALLRFGLFLSFINIIYYIIWTYPQNIILQYYSDKVNLCWSFIDDCSTVQLTSPEAIQFLFNLILGTSILTAFAFLLGRFLNFAWFALIGLSLLRAFVLLQDYRLMSHLHYMLFVLTAVFLFAPFKKKMLKWFLVIFYLNLAMLKLNSEWLSGYNLSPAGIVDYKLELIAAAIVILLALLPIGLLVKSSRIFLTSVIGLFLFHVTTWAFTLQAEQGIYILFLIYFIYTRSDLPNSGLSLDFQSYIKPLPNPVIVPIIIVTYIAIQFSPFSMQNQKAVKDCDLVTFLNYKNEIFEKTLFENTALNKTLTCDPFVIYRYTKELCNSHKNDKNFEGIFQQYSAVGFDAANFYRLDNFCSKEINFLSTGGSNNWIQKTKK